MHNKTKCRDCVYHRNISFLGTICNYSTVTDNTCLTVEAGQVVDKRGGDYNNCYLFKRGRAIDKEDWENDN